jgi:hypothetical protein
VRNPALALKLAERRRGQQADLSRRRTINGTGGPDAQCGRDSAVWNARWVGSCCSLVLLAVGFGYYTYTTAQRKGWFQRKITYETCVSSAAGLKVGDPVKLLGFDVGEITAVIPNDPYAYYNITLQFRVKVNQYNYQGYIWSDSRVKVNAGDLLGNRFLEITKGVGGAPTISTNNEVPAVLRDDFIRELQKKRFTTRRQAELEAARRENRLPKAEAACWRKSSPS